MYRSGVRTALVILCIAIIIYIEPCSSGYSAIWYPYITLYISSERFDGGQNNDSTSMSSEYGEPG